MAFFDQLSKTINSVSQNVSQQTKNITDISRYNSSIAEKERKIEDLYLKMGEKYYLAHKDSNDDETGFVAEINSLFTEIKNDKSAIERIKGVITCPSCGNDNPKDSTFCSKCGTRLVEVPKEPTEEILKNKCPSCGASIEDGNLFCTSCGFKLESVKDVT